MKKSCNGCKAFDWNQYYGKCYLDYKVAQCDLNLTCIPLEECPKPLTNKKLVQISLDRSRGKTK